MTLSPAAKQQNTHVLWTELGVAILTIWKFILNVPPPLSPPIFIRFDAGLIRDESKGPSSEQQGQFSAPVAATHSTMHLVHTSALHGSSSGCVRRLEHS